MKWEILAGLRFFLALVVVSDHLIDMFPGTGGIWKGLYKLGGFSAVIGFFLVSGYSIAHSITQNQIGFYKRRFLRIYPLYVCAILFSLFSAHLAGFKIYELKHDFAFPSLNTIAGNLFLTQGFLVRYIAPDPALWTLSIEWFYYLLAPIFLRLSHKALIALICFSSTLFMFFPYCVEYIIPDKSYHYSCFLYGLASVLLMWAWLLGFFYFFNKNRVFAKILVITLGCVLLEQNQVVGSRWAISTYILSSLTLIYSSNIQIPKIFLGALNSLGELSYPLYLFHVPSFILVYSMFGVKEPTLLVAFALTVSMIFYYSVDVFFRRKRDRKRILEKDITKV
jgi:peptidoglycan/LPS O-acetylase OafA/YrhL